MAMQEPTEHDAGTAPKLRPEMLNLLTTQLAAAENLEVVVSRVEVPGGIELPMHYHPGEEFAYVVAGTITLKLQGEEDRDYSDGKAGVVPSRALHTIYAKTPAVLVVFRVHEKGQPVRVIVKPDGEEVPLDR